MERLLKTTSSHMLSFLLLFALLLTGGISTSIFNKTCENEAYAASKAIKPAGYYYKTTEKTHREITITKTATGIDYKLKYTKLSLPYDTKNNTSVVVEGLTGSAIKVKTNVYRQTIGDYSITFTFTKKNKVRYMTIKQKGTLSGQEGDYSFSAKYVHFTDEQDAGGPDFTVPKAKKPGKVTIERFLSSMEKITVYFKPLKKNCKGYQAQISESKKFKKKISKDVSGKENSGTEFSGLKPHKKYYVRVRAYNINSVGKKSYGKWSRVKSAYAG